MGVRSLNRPKPNILDNSICGKVDLHSLRHTFATRCIESGMPAKVVQKVLGHTDISITLRSILIVMCLINMLKTISK